MVEADHVFSHELFGSSSLDRRVIEQLEHVSFGHNTDQIHTVVNNGQALGSRDPVCEFALLLFRPALYNDPEPFALLNCSDGKWLVILEVIVIYLIA